MMKASENEKLEGIKTLQPSVRIGTNGWIEGQRCSVCFFETSFSIDNS